MNNKELIRALSWMAGKLADGSNFSDNDREVAYSACLLAVEELSKNKDEILKEFLEKLP